MSSLLMGANEMDNFKDTAPSPQVETSSLASESMGGVSDEEVYEDKKPQELLLYKNRVLKTRVTALGGGLIGLLIGVLFSTLLFIGGGVRDDINDHRRLVNTAENIASPPPTSEQSKEGSSNLRKDEEKQFAHPSQAWVDLQIESIEKIDALVSAFPPFKTDAYKVSMARLTLEIEAQKKLLNQMKDGANEAAQSTIPGCAIGVPVSGCKNILSSPKTNLSLITGLKHDKPESTAVPEEEFK